MSTSSEKREAVVERQPADDQPDDLTNRALRLRIRQQELLADLGVVALQGADFGELLDHTVKMTAEGLKAEFSKVMEYIAGENKLLIRAGVGWGEGVVGRVTIGADMASPAGYALRTGKPVISNHLENEQRFRTPELLIEYGIHRAVNVILQGEGSPFGVLEVDSKSAGEFGEHDIAFLQGAANILGMAIEQQKYQLQLQAALERHQILLKEINHRVKNSLQMVSGMLQLQASAIDNKTLSDHLTEASTRISAVGRAYERLAYNADYDNIGLVSYLREVINDLEAAVAPCQIQLEAPEEIEFSADRAILVALVINELISNAGKHAYPNTSRGVIWVRVVRSEQNLVLLSVRDEGVGLPDAFNHTTSKGLGSRLINAMAKQLGAELTRPASATGANFALSIPLRSGNRQLDA
jgi:two-component sensor histidine kinase